MVDLKSMSRQELVELLDDIGSELTCRDVRETAQQEAQRAAERYAEVVKDDPAHDWSSGAVVGPGDRVVDGDTEFVNTSKAWLSVPPSEYPLGYERTETPEDVAPFQPDEQVEPGELREYEGTVYEVLQAHTTAAHWSPDEAHSLWTRA